ncbi:MAG TPA: TonB-dependent receptor [Puia sp.]|nr:TonB-dependent receptor [Puia sp.]
MPFKTSGLTRVYLVLSFLLLSSSLFAQTTVTGKVIGSADKNPVPFATVQVKGERGATQTAADGTFSIRITKSSGTLVISAVGFETLQVPVNGTAALGILTLNASASTLNDIVVTGYTAQKKKDITGSVAVVDMKDMKAVPGTSAEALLQGQAAGVQVVNSGAPGGYSNIRIRGVNSIGNVDPLVIVDGVQSSMHDLNMADIESIQILKDAGAVAIYGIQGSNGVVIITTKRGKGKNSISYDGFYGTQQPVKGFDLANSQTYANAIWLQYYNAGIIPGNLWFGQGGPTYAPPTLPQYLGPTPYADSKGTPNPNYLADQNPATYSLDTNQIVKTSLGGNNWFKDIFKSALWMQHTISASGGSDKSSYYVSFGYLDQQGTLINTYLKRYSVRVNTTFNVKDHIRFGENAYILFKDNPQILNENEGNAISYSYRTPPLIPTYDIKGNWAGTHSFTINNSDNPVADQVNGKNNKGNYWQINGNVFGDVDFLQHFTLHSSVGGAVQNYYYYQFQYTPYWNAEGSTAANNFTEAGGFSSLLVWTNTLAYNQQFGDHSIKALIGTESKDSTGRGLQGQRASYFSTATNSWTLNNGAAATQANSNQWEPYQTGNPYQTALFSLFGRVDYAYKDKYLISGTVRRDGSSVFANGYQHATFPSVSAAWRISKEDFMKDVTWLQDLKIRGSWGKSGSLNNVPQINPYTLFNSTPFNSNYDLNGTSTGSQQGFYNSQLGNTFTTWENDILTDVGVDATLGRFDVTVDWFRKTTQGLLYQAQLPATVGGGTPPYVNFGNLQNQGIDGAIGYHQTVNKDFKFDVLATFTHFTNKVVSLPPGINYYDNFTNYGSNRIGAFTRIQPGHAVGEFFGYKVIGYFSDSSDVAKSPTQSGAAPGAFKYADVDHSGDISDSDRTWIGNPNPKLMYGLDISLTYKNWDFGAYFYGVYGNDVFNYVKYWTAFPQVFEGNVQADLIQNSWSPSNLHPKYPQITNVGSFSNADVVNSWYVEKGSYFRLKSLNIGYSLAPATLQKVGINRLRIYVQGANLFTITKYSGLDPELQGSNLSDQTNIGIDLGNYPANQKTFIVGLNLNF